MFGETQHRTIGKYEVLGPLGRGAMGVVYKARDPEIGRVVAIKTLRKLLSSHLHNPDAAVERFRNEARSAGNLRHPNIITIFEIGRDGDTPFIVMDYVDGRSLEQLLSDAKRLEPARVIRYIRQIGAALDYAHSKGVIHRDIKPANILVDSTDTVFVLDFGIASINDSMSAQASADAGGVVMGTPSYMSPEQIMNEKLDARADLFALAIVAFECLTGERPFRGETFNEVVGNIVGGKGRALTAVAPHLPLALEAEFRRALAKDREDRFASATEMVEAFARALRLEALSPAVVGAISLAGPRGRSIEPPPLGESSPPTRPPLEPRPEAEVRRTQAMPGDPFRAPALFESGRFKATAPRSPLHRATIVLGVICLVLAGGVALVLLTSPSDPSTGEASPAEIEARLSVGDAPTEAPAPAPPSEAEQPLITPEVEPVTPGQPIRELTDKQLLGVVMSKTSAEGSIVEALRLARERRVTNLVDGAVVPLTNDSYLVRVEALKTLAEIGDRRAVPRVVLLLDDHDPIVRAQAARSLGALADRRALGYLSARFAQEPSREVRAGIQRAIEQISGVPFGR